MSADAGIGHNSEAMNGSAKSNLRSLVERVERLETEKSEVSEAIKEVYAEAKGQGFDAKILRKVIARRKLDKARYEEEMALIDLYFEAL